MKKFFSMVVAIAVIVTSLPAYAYNRTEYRNRVTELRELIAQCKAQGINTQNEEIDTNVIATYAERIGDVFENNIPSTIIETQLSELDTLYTNAKANLQAYLAGSKQAPAKPYSYETGNNYQIDGKSLKTVNGTPYFSIGFGHFNLYPYMEEFNSYGYDNIQTLVGLRDAIAWDRNIDNWDTSISGGANVSFSIYNDGSDHGQTMHVVNTSQYASNVYGRIFQRIAVKPNTAYAISFYVKGTSHSSTFTYTTNEGLHNQVAITGLEQNSWKNITASFITGEDEFFKGFTFVFNGPCDVYIDDVTIHKNGDSRNLIRNGGFDGDGYSDFDVCFENNSTLNELLRTLYAAEQNDIHAELLLQLQQGMPDFLCQRYPGLIDSTGRYNSDMDIAVEVEQAYIEAIMGLISDYSSVTSIILVNEPDYNTSRFGNAYSTQFANHLQSKHGNIANLNSKYGSSYSSFSDVGIPTAFEPTQRYYDWKNFNDSVFVDWYQRTVAIIKDYNPNMPVSLKTQTDLVPYEYISPTFDIRGEQMNRGANMELLAQYSDFHGNDAYASLEDDTLRELSLKWYDYLGSISDKPIYNSENHITKDAHGNSRFDNDVNKYIKNDILQSAMHGLDMSSIWTWDIGTDTSSNRYGHLAMRPFAIAEVSKTNLDINRFSTEITALANAQPDLAILRSDASRIYNSYYMHALHRAYLAALESGHKVGFVTTNNIDSLSKYSTLIIPYTTNVEASIIDAINGFGGRIIMIGNDSLAKTEYNNSYSGDMLTKVNNIKNKATKYAVTTNSANYSYIITAPTKATLSRALRSGRVVTVTNSDDSVTNNVDWQYTPYDNGYLVNIDNQGLESTKTLKVKINGSEAIHLTSFFDGVETNGTLSLGPMTGGLYYVSNLAGNMMVVGTEFTDAFGSKSVDSNFTSGTRYSLEDPYGGYFIVTNSDGQPGDAGYGVRIKNNIYCNGTRGIQISTDSNTKTSQLDIVFMQAAAGNEYHVSFNKKYFKGSNAYMNSATSYVTVNGYSSTTCTNLVDPPSGTSSLWHSSLIRGESDNSEWRHYEGIITQATPENGYPTLSFKAMNSGKLYVDDIIITDKYGNMLFATGFETKSGNGVSEYSKMTKSSENLKLKVVNVGYERRKFNHALLIENAASGSYNAYITIPHCANNISSIEYDILYDSLTASRNETGRKNLLAVGTGTFDSAYDSRFCLNGKSGHVSITNYNNGGYDAFRIITDSWARAIIDNIVIKNSSGDIIYSEDFEETVVYIDGEDEILSYKDGWEQQGDPMRAFTIKKQENGNHRLRVYGKNGNTGNGNVGTYRISLPRRAADEEYHITYDVELPGGNSTSASLDVSGTSIYGAGQITNAGGDHVVTGSGNYLYFAAEGWANAYVDNIVVKDKYNNVIFTEDFENFDNKYNYYVYESKLQGLSANGLSDGIYLSWKNPNRDDIADIQIFENNEEIFESILFSEDITLLPGETNIIKISDGFAGTGTVHTYDVRMMTNSGLLYHNLILAKEAGRFFSSTKTKDDITLQGWSLSSIDGSIVKGLGSVCYDTMNKAEGNASLHINPNIMRRSSEQQYDSDKTSVMTVYGNGETMAHFYLDAQVYGIEAGKTYKLTWSQKGHHAPSYYIYAVDFTVGGGSTIGALTGQNGYTNYTAWQDREIQFTVSSVAANGSPRLRIDFSNGCDDFWLDDVKLCEVGQTVNIITNGNFEYGSY